MKSIYLDYNATSPLHEGVLEAMTPFLKEHYGNASAVYQKGQHARKAIEEARQTMATFIGAEDPNEIVFTSGATESNNMALKGVIAASKKQKPRVVSSSIEHSSVRNVLTWMSEKNQIQSVVTPVQPNGIVDVKSISDALTNETALVSVMMVNNETGVIQSIKEFADHCHKKGILFHSDAVQAAGKIEINVQNVPVDLLSLSAHKFGGPKGSGILYIRKGTRMESLLQGGTHEKSRRAGTENVAGIVGMAKAAEISMTNMKSKNETMASIRNRIEDEILKKIPRSAVNGDRSNRVSNTSNIRFECIDSSGLIMALDLKGISCSNGSACATGSVEASHVLLAMGLPQDKAHGAIRFSLGIQNKKEDVAYLVSTLAEVVHKMRQDHPMWKEAVNQ